MTITHAKWEKPRLLVDRDGKAILDPEGKEQFIHAVTAGPIEGQTWSGITEASRFWPIVQEWEAAGNVIEPYIEPEVEPSPPAPLIYAIAHLTVDSGAISSITPSARIGGAFYIDVGVYWVFFATPHPDTEYIPLCYNHSHNVTVSDRYEDFFVVTAELDGLPSDPPSFCVEIKRVT